MGTEKELTRKAFLKLSASAAVVTITGCPADDASGDGSTGGTTASEPTMTGPPEPTATATSPTTAPPPDGSTSTGIDDPTMDSTPESTTTTTGGDSFPPLTSSSSGTGSDTDTDTGTGADCSAGASATTITKNHGHTADIPPEMLVPATPVMDFDIQGDGDHAHTISLTGDEVDMLLAGMAVTVTSSDSGHTHDVTLLC